LDVPRGVLLGVKNLCNIDLLGNSTPNLSRVDRAYIPELGLSNKAADLMSSQEQAELAARNVSTLSWTTPPLEGQLSDHTLWPEINKLFGHTNDVVCLTISPNGLYVATACKARNAETSSILVWDTTSCACKTINCHIFYVF
jgi:elongator complex protein 2